MDQGPTHFQVELIGLFVLFVLRQSLPMEPRLSWNSRGLPAFASQVLGLKVCTTATFFFLFKDRIFGGMMVPTLGRQRPTWSIEQALGQSGLHSETRTSKLNSVCVARAGLDS